MTGPAKKKPERQAKPRREECPFCGMRLNPKHWSADHSMTGSQLMDHVADYHENDPRHLGPACWRGEK